MRARQPMPAGPLVSIVGGGAVGGLLAALLARAGRPVELVVRERYRATYDDGIVVTMAGRSFRQPVTVRTTPSVAAALVVIAVKMPDLDAACREVAARWPAHQRPAQAGTVPAGGQAGPAGLPPVLLLQNGLESLDVAARHLPLATLYGAVVELGATALTAGEITYSIPGSLLIGGADAEAAEGGRVAALLAPAVPARVTSDVRGAQRLKLLVNLNNGVGAATGLSIQQLYASRAGVRLSLGVMREGLAVLDAAGLAPPAGRRSRLLRLALGLPDAFGIAALRLVRVAMRQRAPVYTSTLQSLRRHRRSEIAWLNGTVVRLGRQHGVPVPQNAAVVATVEALEAGTPGATYSTPVALLAEHRDATPFRPVEAG